MTESTPEVPAEPEGLPEDANPDDYAGDEVHDPTIAEEDQ